MKAAGDVVDRYAFWKWLLLLVLLSWSMVLITPLSKKLKLGLDLRGGTSFVLEVDVSALEEDARRDALERALEVVRNRVDAMGVSEPVIYPEPRNNRIVVQIPGLRAEERQRAIENLKRAAYLEFRLVHPKNDHLVQSLFEKGLAPPGYRIVKVEEEDASGRWISTYLYQEDPSRVPEGMSREELREKLGSFQAPPGYEFMLKKEIHHGQELYRPYFVKKRPELTGEYLKTAGVDIRQLGQPVVTLRFDAKGARKFARVTENYAPGGPKNPSATGRRYLAIVLDGTLYSAPFIKTPIYGGEAVIEGNFTPDEARDLAIVLRAGALPAPLRIVEERAVDPTLGRDSIRSGKRATIMAGVAVMVFMLLYYRLSGTVADGALILDLLLLPLGMMIASGFLGLLTAAQSVGNARISLPTLTLPGIAGIALTAGMAVDANILIFERIREELRGGKRIWSAITAGYERAFRTILDANVTTIITAVILFWQGSGPIRGFAVTLTAGILVSMYTALVVTKMLFHLMVGYLGLKNIRMMRLFTKPQFDFLGKRTIGVLLSLLVIGGSWTAFVIKGERNLGVDFTGGRSITFAVGEHIPVEEIRSALQKAGIGEAQIQYVKRISADLEAAKAENLEVRVAFDAGNRAREALLSRFGDRGLKVLQEDSVGPKVGRELQRKAVIAIVFALVGIVIYITLRFEFGFAIGAIVALAHDVLITVGVYCLLGRQLSLPIIAALLTIVGYSVNDTIVVFDRIRENLRLRGSGASFIAIANSSINQTLSRTLLTSVTTLLSVGILLFFGGGAINDFALTLFIGIIVGTYSSIFIATPVTLLWHREKRPESGKTGT
ncbi:MAG: protein translocase subunit SecDF [Verrucomicrobia bacterium]|nr:MAG: protein translocase subunit SecDF [Verrucomicrobiota bacterium]